MSHGRNATLHPLGNVVLILDDDALHLDMLSERIEAEGYRVVATQTPEEAIAAAAEVDFVILDFYLPGLPEDEYGEFVLKLRAQNPSLTGALLTSERANKARMTASRVGLSWFYKPDLQRDFRVLLEAIEEATADVEPMDEFGARYNRREKQVTIGGVTATLRPTAYRLLDMLRQTPYEPVSYDELCACLEQGPLATYPALKNQIKNLRKELRDQGVQVNIVAERGEAYVLRDLYVAEPELELD